jgi:hypothetical protein
VALVDSAEPVAPHPAMVAPVVSAVLVARGRAITSRPMSDGPEGSAAQSWRQAISVTAVPVVLVEPVEQR